MSDPYFDDESRPVPAVEFDYDAVDSAVPDQADALRAIRSQSWNELMTVVAGRETDDVAIFRRFFYAMFIIGNPLAPKSYRSLAHHLRIPRATVHRQVGRLKVEFAELIANNRMKMGR